MLDFPYLCKSDPPLPCVKEVMNQTQTTDSFVKPLHRSPTKRRSMAEMGMTSMADVTFLLLIFFMVTASFVMQSAFQTPTQNDGTVTNKELASPIEIRLTPFGEFEVAFGNLEFQPVNSKHEL